MKILKASERFHANLGWLDAHQSFSFDHHDDPDRSGFRDLRILNDDTVMPGSGFGTHPHRDVEIITYVLEGAIEHKDSMGNGRVIRPGEVQYMSAGTGVRHSEFNPSKDQKARMLQIWILPDTKGVAPHYAHRSLRYAPTGKLHLIASKSGRDGSISIHQDADLWLAKFEPGQAVGTSLAKARYGWVHVAEGEVVLNGVTLSGGDAAALSNPTELRLSANNRSQVLLFDMN